VRKTVMLMAIAVALPALGVSTVFAQEQAGTIEEDGMFVPAQNQVIQCVGVPCTASGNDDLVHERVGNGKKDKILLKGGDDQVRADSYSSDQDTIEGSSGFDLIYVNDGDTRDRILGGKGNDRCIVDARSEAVSGCSRIIVE
jgi:hypothetical protein